MKKHKALIVDDEPLAREIIQTFLGEYTELTIAGSCRNAMEAFALLNQVEVEIIFLDINMPEVSGIDFVKMLKKAPLIVFTTAYAEFALESYSLNAVDYLLKPIAKDRFRQAMGKVIAQLKLNNSPDELAKESNDNSLLFVRSEGKWMKIDLAKLQWAESLKDYVRLWTAEGRITIHSTMKNLEDQLSAHPKFVRIHKSFLVNLEFVQQVDVNEVCVAESRVAIGSSYKSALQERLNQFRLL
jgi:DNA-binding LytR/AlgR family response regulator